MAAVPCEEDIVMAGEYGSGCDPCEFVVVDRFRSAVAVAADRRVDVVVGARDRSLTLVLPELEPLSLLVADGNCRELWRLGTGIGGAMLVVVLLLLPLSVLGLLLWLRELRWCAAAPFVIMAARRIFCCCCRGPDADRIPPKREDGIVSTGSG